MRPADLLHRDQGPEGATAMGGLIAMTDGAIGLFGLLEADALQLLAPVGHARKKIMADFKPLAGACCSPLFWLASSRRIVD